MASSSNRSIASSAGTASTSYVRYNNRVCKCGVRAAMKISRSIHTPGRLYYKCGNGEGECGFWEWCNRQGGSVPQVRGDESNEWVAFKDEIVDVVKEATLFMRKSQPEEHMHLLPIFMRKAEESRLTDMVDEFSEDMQLHRLEAAETMKAAVWCLQSDFTRRPTMHSVVSVLEGKMDVGADLDFSIHNPTTMAARRSEADPGETTPLLPSILSGPR